MNFSETLEHLLDTEEGFEPSAFYNLSRLDTEEFERLTGIWSSIPAQRRHNLIRRLVEIAEANFEVDFELIFRWGLTDNDPEVRAASVEGLWENEELRLMHTLSDMVKHDASPRVRAAAALSLGRFLLKSELGEIPEERWRPIYESLRDLVFETDEVLEVRRRALESIAYVGEDEVATLLREAYEHPEEKMRISAVFGMGRSADERWISTLIGELFSINPEMRYEAARACGELEAREAVSRLAELIEDPDREVQEAALWALGQTGGDRARRVLERCLEEGDPVTRKAAEAALEHLELMFGELDLPFYALRDVAPDSSP